MVEKRYKILIYIVFVIIAEPILAQQFSFESDKKVKSNFNKKLEKALISNKVKSLREILIKDPNLVNASSSQTKKSKYSALSGGNIPLLYDAVNRSLNGYCSFEIVELILSFKPKLNCAFRDKTPFYLILEFLAKNKIVNSKDAEKLFLTFSKEKNLDINNRYGTLPPPLTFLLRENYEHLSGKISNEYLSDKILKTFIKKGANVNALDKYGNNLLTYASKTKRQKLLNLLLNKGISFSNKNKSGKDPFIFAIENNNIEAINKILDKGYELNLYYLYNKKAENNLNKYSDIRNKIYNLAVNKDLDFKESIGFLGLFKKNGNKWYKKYSSSTADIKKVDYPRIIDFITKNNVKIEERKFYKLQMDYLYKSNDIDEIVVNAEKINFNLDFNFVKDYWKSELGVSEMQKKFSKTNIFNIQFTNTILKKIIKKQNNYFNSIIKGTNLYNIFDLNISFPSRKNEIQKVLYNKLLKLEKNRSYRVSFWNPIDSYERALYMYTRHSKLFNKYISTYGNDEKMNTILSNTNDEINWIQLRINSLRAEQKAEQKAREAKYAMEQCNKCTLDIKRTTFPSKEKGFFGTVNKSGEIVMKNDTSYTFDYSDGKYTLNDDFLFFSGTKFNSFEEMLNHFLKECKREYCK